MSDTTTASASEEAPVTQVRPVRRQARGERRIVQILDAALDLFAEVGYEAASTNRIAAKAGISPGSLYQFFANKEAIAEALSARLAEAMRAAYAPAFDDNAIATLPIDEMLDRVLDPLVEFNVRHPGTKALVGGPDMPPQLAAATQPLQDALNARVVAMVGLRLPDLSAAERDRAAFVILQIVRAMMPSILAAGGAERAALTAELKKALRGYLEPS
ncbi:TetR/AcrR family transcriptional regulator [Pseudonocardia aurantiaca]|uniref:TetR/AcrR family transcriptional regulator n=1 Tax=Pseudonocardia aurantiaca TaxID=75290 RepID=A0ABW4FPJ3_9PSEU